MFLPDIEANEGISNKLNKLDASLSSSIARALST